MNKPENDVISIRSATRQDLPAIITLLADDSLGAKREDPAIPLQDCYQLAFEAIEVDPNNELVVATAADQILGVLQITFIPNLTYKGGWRAQVEGVRVSEPFRSSGIGRSMFEWAIDRAQEKGCMLVQLTTDKLRPDALRFYESLGFIASHEGMKRKL